MMTDHTPKVEVLISCMFQDGKEIIRRSNIQSDVLVINQCDENSEQRFQFENKRGEKCVARVINTTERGLSKSRNMAISNACGDICLICDDDEYLIDNYVTILKKSASDHPEYSVFAFRFDLPENYYMKKTFWNEQREVNYASALKISSIQIAFRLNKISTKNIRFDETVGSGVTKAGGEEKIFQHDCLRKGLRILYQPITIGTMSFQDSQWAHHIFTESYFHDWGFYTKKLRWGKLGATIMSVLFALKKRDSYKSKTSVRNALWAMMKGIWCN